MTWQMICSKLLITLTIIRVTLQGEMSMMYIVNAS